MTTTTVTANADGTRGDWVTLADGTTNLHTGIDEGIASAYDGDGIKCGTENDACYFLLQDMPENFDQADTGQSITVRIRGRNSTSKGDAIGMGSVQLVKADESTALTNALTPAFTTTTGTWWANLTLTGDRDKTSFDGACLRVSSGTGTAGTVQVYTADVDIDHSETEPEPDPEPAPGTGREILVKSGTPIVWSGSGGDYALTMANLANNEARQGEKADLGAARATRYTFIVRAKPSTAPSGKNLITVYWSGSSSSTPGDRNSGSTSGTDAAFMESVDDSEQYVRQMKYICTLSCTSSGSAGQVASPPFFPLTRYGMPVILNECGTALSADDADHKITLVPQVTEVQ